MRQYTTISQKFEMKHIIGSFSHLSPLSFQLFPSLSFNLLLALSLFSIHCPPFHLLRSAPCSFPFPFSPLFLPLPFQFYLYYPSLQPLSTLSFPFPVIYFPFFFLSFSLFCSFHLLPFLFPFPPFPCPGVEVGTAMLSFQQKLGVAAYIF